MLFPFLYHGDILSCTFKTEVGILYHLPFPYNFATLTCLLHDGITADYIWARR